MSWFHKPKHKQHQGPNPIHCVICQQEIWPKQWYIEIYNGPVHQDCAPELKERATQ